MGEFNNPWAARIKELESVDKNKIEQKESATLSLIKQTVMLNRNVLQKQLDMISTQTPKSSLDEYTKAMSKLCLQSKIDVYNEISDILSGACDDNSDLHAPHIPEGPDFRTVTESGL